MREHLGAVCEHHAEMQRERLLAEEERRRGEVGRIAAEQARVDAALAAGKNMMMSKAWGTNRTVVVHSLNCYLAKRRLARHQGVGPEPVLVSSEDLEFDLRFRVAWRACGVCDPPVPRPRNVRRHKPQMKRVRELRVKDLGRKVIAPEVLAGILEAFKSAGDNSVLVRTDRGELELSDEDAISFEYTDGTRVEELSMDSVRKGRRISPSMGVKGSLRGFALGEGSVIVSTDHGSIHVACDAKIEFIPE